MDNEVDALEAFMEIFPYPWTEEAYNEIYGEDKDGEA